MQERRAKCIKKKKSIYPDELSAKIFASYRFHSEETEAYFDTDCHHWHIRTTRRRGRRKAV